jgi:glycosyltransferase involved in cell wall biosynthesis
MTKDLRAGAEKRILQIGNWPPPVCGWSMGLVGLRQELESRGWDCPVMNLNENRRIKSSEYIDVQSGQDYFRKVLHWVRRGYAVHVRVNGDTKKGYLLALCALLLARLWGTRALLTYCGGHQQNFFPAPKGSFRHLAFSFLFRVSSRVYCDSQEVKAVILTTGISPEKVAAFPHFSSQHTQFEATPLPPEVEQFCRKQEAVFFVYACYRKEYALEFLADVLRRFRASFPRVGFLLVGTSAREVPQLLEFLDRERLSEAVCVTGSVPHDLFLTMMTRSLACVRTPLTDGVSASVLEALIMKVPVLASDNGSRPLGVELFSLGDAEGLLSLMTEAVTHRERLVARIPRVTVDDNAGKLADDIERACLGDRSTLIPNGRAVGETRALDGR